MDKGKKGKLNHDGSVYFYVELPFSFKCWNCHLRNMSIHQRCSLVLDNRHIYQCETGSVLECRRCGVSTLDYDFLGVW